MKATGKKMTRKELADFLFVVGTGDAHEINRAANLTATAHGLPDGDWAWLVDRETGEFIVPNGWEARWP